MDPALPSWALIGKARSQGYSTKAERFGADQASPASKPEESIATKFEPEGTQLFANLVEAGHAEVLALQ